MSHTPGPWPMAMHSEEAKASARLIAAAPDLLEALRELLAVSPYDSTLPEVRPAVDKSIAALRKATGD